MSTYRMCDLSHIGENLRAVFPQLASLTSVRMLGEGFRSMVVETDAGIVFRIAKNQEAADGHAKERRFLPVLRMRVPIAIPDLQWYASPSDRFPFGVIGYPKLAGTPLCPEYLSSAPLMRMASDVATFLLALHGFPVEEAIAMGLPGPDIYRSALEAMHDEVLPPLHNVLTEREYEVIIQWWETFLSDQVMEDYTPVVRHGDLWYENILVDEKRNAVVGIVDFEHAAVGDPAQDFATLLHLGEDFARCLIDAYEAVGGSLDEGFAHRMQRLWEMREFEGLQFAVRFADAVEFEDAVRKLRRGPILKRFR